MYACHFLSLNLIGETFAARAVVALASATNVNFIERAIAAVVIILAVGYVASNAEINGFHTFTSVKILCAAVRQIMRGY